MIYYSKFLVKFFKRIEIHEILSYVKIKGRREKWESWRYPKIVYFHSVAKFFAETTSAIVRSSDTFKATTRLVYTRSLTFFGRFHLKPLFWENSPRMEGHDLDQPGDWYPAVAARSRRYLVSTSIAKQPEREIRPVISVSLLLHPFLRRFSFTLLFFPLSLSLSPLLPL